MCKKPLVLAIGLLSGLSFTVNAEEPTTKLEKKLPKLSLQQCAELFPNMEQKVQTEVHEEKIERLALVIGNQKYDHKETWESLTKTKTDASAMESKFRKHDFYVLHKNDAKKDDLDRLVCRMGFILKHSPVKTAAFYYSGHGLQNVIVPKDMETANASDPNAFSVDNIVEVMRDSHQQNPFVKNNSVKRNHLVLLDSCRDSDGESGKGSKKGSKGTNGRIGDKEAAGGPLTIFRPTNLIVSYAAAPTQSSYEDDSASHSFYTKALLEHLFQPSVPIKTAFSRIREQVYNDTLHFVVKQQNSSNPDYKDSKPQEIFNDDSIEDFYLAGQQKLDPMIAN